MRRSSISLVLLSFVAFGTPANAYDFTWTGWFGPTGTNPAWGANWTWDNQQLHNGWGGSWWYWEDPAPHFPNTGSSVLIPAGAYVDTDGGGQPYCGSLTLGEAAVFEAQYSNVSIGGPTLHNDGTIRLVAGGGSISGFEMSGPLSIEGTGEIVLAPGRFFTWAPPAVLTIGSEQYVHGDGSFGFLPYGNYHGVALENHGHVQATSATNPLDVYGTGVRNTGTFEATGGALLRLWGDWDNTGGELLASAGGIVYLAADPAHSASVEGGTLRTSGGGEIRTQGGGATISDVTVDGVLHIFRYEGAHMSGTITNLGTIDQGTEGWAGSASIQVDQPLTFAGSGVLRMGDANPIHMYDWPATNERVTNGPEHTIDCYGGQFGTAPDYYGDRRIELVNEGTLHVFDSSYGARFHVTGSGFENRGDFVLEPAASVNAELWGEFTQTSGRLVTNDGFLVHDGALDFSGGVLTGSGYVQGAVTIRGSASVNPGTETGPGTLNAYGPVDFAGGATLACQWTPDAQDLFRVNGHFGVNGTNTVRVEFPAEGPSSPIDYTVLRADDHEDLSAWVVELPDEYSSAGLEWVGHDLVVRGLGHETSGVAGLTGPGTRLEAAPDPFGPATTIRFSNSSDGPVDLWVSDSQGRRVRSLFHGVRAPGAIEVVWDGRSDSGRALFSGAYFCVLETRTGRESIRLTLLR